MGEGCSNCAEVERPEKCGESHLGRLDTLGIKSVKELARQSPTFLFHELERRTKRRQDPCVWDVFAAIIHEAATGEASNWWDWTEKTQGAPKEWPT